MPVHRPETSQHEGSFVGAILEIIWKKKQKQEWENSEVASWKPLKYDKNLIELMLFGVKDYDKC